MRRIFLYFLRGLIISMILLPTIVFLLIKSNEIVVRLMLHTLLSLLILIKMLSDKNESECEDRLSFI